MGRFGTWGLSLVTMVSVATAVLLVTGWGSAMASSLSLTGVIVKNPIANPANMHEVGTANVNVTNATPLSVQATNTDAQGNIKVHEQGTANVNVTNSTPLPVSGSIGITGTPTVSIAGTPSVSLSGTPSVTVGNFPDAPKTAIIGRSDGGPVQVPAQGSVVVFSGDVSAYRELTLYLDEAGYGLTCEVDTTIASSVPGVGNVLATLDSFNMGQSQFVTKTYDPAPPDVQVQCGGGGGAFYWMLAGRTG